MTFYIEEDKHFLYSAGFCSKDESPFLKIVISINNLSQFPLLKELESQWSEICS